MRPPVRALMIGLVVLVLGMAGPGCGRDRELPEGGSRYGQGIGAESVKGESLLDALAPLLYEGDAAGSRTTASAPRRRTAAAPRLTLPLGRAVAQLFVVGFQGTDPTARFFTRLHSRDWGGVVLTEGNYLDSSQLAALAGEVSVVARLAGHTPPLVMAAQPGGAASAFPDLPPRGQAELGAQDSARAVRAEARRAARQLRSLNFNATLAPEADLGVAAGPADGRAFAEDPGVVTRMVRAAVDGYRSERFVSAVGHFPGQGGASQAPEEGAATVGLSLPDLRARDVRPFAAVARTVPIVVMSNAAYAAFDGITPAGLVRDAITRFLRGNLRYRGVVMTSDLGAATAATGQPVAAAALAALSAGADLLYVPGGEREQEEAYRAVLRAARQGRLSRGRLALSVARIQRLKRAYRVIPAAR
jgi:beta-N-acetylhexosaminidase